MKKNVLIADDEPLVRTVVQTLLETQDNLAVVGQAVNGIDALVITEERHPDLIVLDISMPHMNGMEVTRELRLRHPSLPIVIFTSFDADTTTRAALSAGANVVVSKSKTDTLIGEIHQLLGTAAA